MSRLEKYNDAKYTAIDTDDTGEDSATAWVDISMCDYVGFYVEGKTGTHATHKVGVQCSPDGTFNGGWHDETDGLITGEGHILMEAMNMSYIRIAVHTAEGATSTCDFYLEPLRRK